MNVRPPAVAGMFYPGSSVELGALVDRLLDGDLSAGDKLVQIGDTAITVLAQHLNQRAGRPFPGAGEIVAPIRGALESLADHLAAGTPSPERPALAVAPPAGTPEADAIVYRQLARIVTEIDALDLAAGDRSA